MLDKPLRQIKANATETTCQCTLCTTISGPILKSFNRRRIEMYFDDHPPPHFHVITRKNQRMAAIIDNLIIWAGDADPRDTAKAFSWARENRTERRSRWQEYSEQES